MPKELTHWLVAGAVARGLPGSPWAAPLARCPNILGLGAVAHDALYYLPASAPEICRRVPYVLSGHDGEDSHEVLRLAAESFRETGAAWLPAWIAGLASHICADQTFHPLVFWATGDYHHPDPALRSGAVQRHRAFEALMDLHFLGGADGPRAALRRAAALSLGRTLRGAEAPLAEIFRLGRLTAPARVPPERAAACQARAWRIFAGFQCAARLTPLSRLLHALRGLMPRGLRELAALHYVPAMTRQLPALAGEIDYRHPATGEACRDSLDGLFSRAVARCVEMLRDLEGFVFADAAWPLPHGGSLDGGTAGSLGHFADPPLIRF